MYKGVVMTRGTGPFAPSVPYDESALETDHRHGGEKP